ncbi:MAG: hypothetical protein M3280_02615 [Actinomycetota bacterium]|nr:hypothetical protein [Actinomycetota bacterium]
MTTTARTRSYLGALVVASLFGGALTAALWGEKAKAAPRTDPGRILVVTINMQEAYGADTTDMRETRVFAEKALKVAPKRPDVILLQEVKAKSAKKIRGYLSEKSGDRYVLAAPPGVEPWSQTSRTVTKKDTGILLNSETMRKADSGGYFTTRIAQGDMAKGEKAEIHKHAFVKAVEKKTGLVVPLVSVHFTLNKLFRSHNLAERYKENWVGDISEALNQKYGTDEAMVKVIGGDFNLSQCPSSIDFDVCVEDPDRFLGHHKVLYAHSYVDTFWALHERIGKAIDLIYATADVVNSGVHSSGYTSNPSSPGFYSDHKLRWAHVASRGS